MKHIDVYVFSYLPWRDKGYDPTNGGISGRLNRIEVFSADSTDKEIAEWCSNNNTPIEDVCRLNKRVLWGEKHYFVEPVVKPSGYVGPMHGGNFAYCSDGRWADILGERCGYAVPIHDRFETQEMYNTLSM